jgi:hypothetical protein
VKYLHSSRIDKETIARNNLAQDGVRSGLICGLSCLETLFELSLSIAIARRRNWS